MIGRTLVGTLPSEDQHSRSNPTCSNGNGQAGSSTKLAPMDLAKYRARVLNTYALVAYLPDPLASFLDGLSRTLVPGCKPRAHITLLPPRNLSGSLEDAKSTLYRALGTLAPFELEITTIEIFDATSVIYADVGDGRDQLMEIHRQLNVESLAFAEQFAYHPHVTLALHGNQGNIQELLDVAKLEWAAYEGPRRFRVEELHFVHNEAPDCWTDVAAYYLVASASVKG